MCDEINNSGNESSENNEKLNNKNNNLGRVIAVTIIATFVFICVSVASFLVFDGYIIDILANGIDPDGFTDSPNDIPSPDGENNEQIPEDIPQGNSEDDVLFADPNSLPNGNMELASVPERDTTPILSVSEIYEKVSPSVVVVVGEERAGTSIGTGVIMSADGYIITNEHVVADAQTLYIITHDEYYYSAKIVDTDADSDIALLKIEAENMSAAEFGDSESVKIGENVVSIGTPYGIEYAQTVTDGIISGIRTGVYVNSRKIELLQTNAQLNPGNSGGPLINEYGQVIGINCSKIMTDGVDNYEGMGFSIPTSHVQVIVNGFLSGEKAVGNPVLGLNIVYLDEETAKLNDVVEGAYIVSIDTDSSAYKCGLRAGDVILKLNGKTFTDTDGFIAEKNRFAPGDYIEVTYWSQGKTKTIDVQLMEDMT